ncbi:hypothetical protein C3L33_13478, partial [Rhododendron williamsianum]
MTPIKRVMELRCKPMDYEDCEAFTDVYWVKFRQVNNARCLKYWKIQWIYGSYPRNTGEFQHISHNADSSSMTRVTSDKDYFPTQSMNQTVQFVRDKLNKIQSSTQNIETGPSKKPRVDNRRRI